MPHQLIDNIEKRQMRADHYYVKPGDKVSVHTRIIEGEKERIQIFTGDVIAVNNGRNSNRTTITVRKISNGGFAVEKIIPLHSPLLDKIELKNRGRVRRAKLYYQRSRRGNAAKIKPKNVW